MATEPEFYSYPDETATSLALTAEEAFNSNGEFAHWKNISIRDTAYLIRLNPPFLSGEERNNLFDTILWMQNKDNSWGDSRVTPHSALVDTLEVVRLLVDQPNASDYNQLINSGWEAVKSLLSKSKHYLKHETVALELLVPPLCEYIACMLDPNIGPEEVKKLGPMERSSATYRSLTSRPLDKDAGEYYFQLKEDQAQKLELMRRVSANGDRYFPPGTTAAHAYEAAGLMYRVGALDKNSPDIQSAADYKTTELAGVALSPSATIEAILLLTELGMEVPDEYMRYVEITFNAYKREGLPGVAGFRNTDALWTAIHPLLAEDDAVLNEQSLLDAYSSILNKIRVIEGQGVPWDNALDIADLDDTVLALIYAELLHSKGRGHEVPQNLSYKLINYFFDGEMLTCFKGEMSPSPSHLYHTLFYLDKLRQNLIKAPRPGHNFQEVDKIYNQVLVQIRDLTGGDTFSALDDKWDAGEGYILYRLFNSILLREHPELVKQAFHRTQQRQLKDGGFGTYLYHNSIVDETSHVYLALDSLLNRVSGDSRLKAFYGEDFLLSVAALLKSTEKHLYERTIAGSPGKNKVDKGENDPSIWLAKGVYGSLRMESALRQATHGVMFKRTNEGHYNPYAKKHFTVRPSTPERASIMQTTEAIWKQGAELGRGYGNQRATKRIAIELFKDLDLNVGEATPFASDPPVFNRAGEFLAEKRNLLGNLDQIYTNVISDAAEPKNWELFAHLTPDPENRVKYLMELTAKQIALFGLDARAALKTQNQSGYIDSQLLINEWEELYKQAVQSNYNQEFAKGRAEDEELIVKNLVADDIATIEEYLDLYGETSALRVAIVGAMAHRRGPLTPEIINFLKSPDLKLIVDTSRLIQDLQIDPTERINLGIWLLSRDEGISTTDAKAKLTEGYAIKELHKFKIRGLDKLRNSITQRLEDAYNKYYKIELERLAHSYRASGSEEGAYIAQIFENVLRVNEAIKMFKEQGYLT